MKLKNYKVGAIAAALFFYCPFVTAQTTVPQHFQGKWAVTAQACKTPVEIKNKDNINSAYAIVIKGGKTLDVTKFYFEKGMGESEGYMRAKSTRYSDKEKNMMSASVIESSNMSDETGRANVIFELSADRQKLTVHSKNQNKNVTPNEFKNIFNFKC